MSVIQVSKEIHAPREKVFEVFADLPNAAERVEDIVKLEILTDGPVGLGTRWRETRRMFNREATEEMEITVFDPPNGYAAEAQSHGSRYFSEFRFEQQGDVTVATVSFQAKPLTFLARIMSWLMGRMMRRAVVNCFEKDMDNLKAHIEAGDAASATS